MRGAPQTFTVEEARDLLLGLVREGEHEEVDLLDAQDRILARDVTSDIDVAPFDNSAMDGFAVRAADLTKASKDTPTRLEVISHIAAGAYSDLEVSEGQAARIMTGAPMPPGADSVVKVEETNTAEGDGGVGSIVEFFAPCKVGANVRLRGEEVRAGNVVLQAGEKIGPAAVGLLAATGNSRVWVYARPRVAILSTGDELVEVDQVPGPGQIRNSNSYSLAAQVAAAGGIPVRYPPVADTLEATREAFKKAASEVDFIVTSGGVSVGDFDYVKPVLEELGTLYFCKVNMRPGNPQTMGMIDEVPLFGLPGNPTSTFVGFEMFVRPALLKMAGHTQLDRPTTRARITHDVNKRQDRRYYLRGRVHKKIGEYGNEGHGYEVEIVGNQSSALLTSAHKGNCFVVLPEGTSPIKQGTLVSCVRLDEEEGAE